MARRGASATGFGPAAAEAIDALCDPRRDPPPGEELAQVRARYDAVGIDVGAPDALAALDPERDPVVCFVGKLIVSKGIDLLLAAWPLVLAREPRAKLVVVGFGTYREGVEVLLRGLERADERLLMHVCRQGRALEGGPRDQLTYLRTFLEGLRGRHERYFAAAKKMRRQHRLHGPPRPRRARPRAAVHRGGRDAEHVPRGVRDGGGRGAPPAARCRSARALGPGRGGGDPGGEAAARRCARC